MSVSNRSTKLYTACNSIDPKQQAEGYEALWQYLYPVALKVVYDQPDPEALAQDCAQDALIRIHQRIHECNGPETFIGWSRRIVSRLAIDVLRRRKRLLLIDESSENNARIIPPNNSASPETVVRDSLDRGFLRELLHQAPISPRSYRVFIGRYLDNLPDEKLAQTESELSGKVVRPSHIQVTRSKNIDKLRHWNPLLSFLKEG